MKNLKKYKMEVIGFELFNGSVRGGHWHRLSLLTGLAYLLFYIGDFDFSYHSFYYDMIHKNLWLGFFGISWGTMRGADEYLNK